MATRKKRGSKRNGSPMTWFVAGIIIGLGGAIFLYTQGFIPAMPEKAEPVTSSSSSEPELISEDAAPGGESPTYDFFTVLPEMEVVVPERELAKKSQPEKPDAPAAELGGQYILQAGSFRSSSDADQMKARLALLGSVANVQTVTVNNETWHRVRVGPIDGARQADEIRQQLQSNKIEVLVLKVNAN